MVVSIGATEEEEKCFGSLISSTFKTNGPINRLNFNFNSSYFYPSCVFSSNLSVSFFFFFEKLTLGTD